MEKSRFEFLGFRIYYFNLNIKDKYLLQEENYVININKNIKRSDEDKNFAEISLEIDISSENKNIELNIKIKGAFKSVDEMNDESFTKMCEINAPAILFPYIRAFISSCTSLAGIPPINIPLMNLSNQKETKNKQEQQ